MDRMCTASHILSFHFSKMFEAPQSCVEVITNVQKLDVLGPDEKFCLCWLCALNKFSSGGAIFLVHLIFEQLQFKKSSKPI